LGFLINLRIIGERNKNKKNYI